MSLIGRSSKKTRAEKVGSSADDEYEEVSDEASRLRSQIRDLEGFIEDAPQIREARQQETRVTFPPPEHPGHAAVMVDGEEDHGAGDPQERLGRRHLEAIRRRRRLNFYVFLVSAAAVAAFLYWVSQVVQ